MAKQGKCEKCKIRWVWDVEVALKKLQCPCGQPLKATTHLSNYTVKDLTVKIRAFRGSPKDASS